MLVTNFSIPPVLAGDGIALMGTGKPPLKLDGEQDSTLLIESLEAFEGEKPEMLSGPVGDPKVLYPDSAVAAAHPLIGPHTLPYSLAIRLSQKSPEPGWYAT
jgi:hypothetical protein